MKQHPTARNQALDFTKGFLVIAMVVYHTMSYFLVDRTEYYFYVNYIAGSFLFISGLICGTIYLEKYLNDPQYVYKRLSRRSFKLIALFLSVNIIIHSILKKNYNGQELGINIIFNNLYSIFVTGDSALMAFEILLPIAYLLLVCQLLLFSVRLKYILFVLLIFIFGLTSYKHIDLGLNWNLILIGIGGFYSGIICFAISSILKNKIINVFVILLLLIYFFILVPQKIELNNISFYILINVVIANLYLIGKWLNAYNMITKNIIFFGQYSLLLYLSQIFILQILHKMININILWFNTGHFLIIIAVNLCLLFICQGTRFLRDKYIFVDNIYRLIFS